MRFRDHWGRLGMVLALSLVASLAYWRLRPGTSSEIATPIRSEEESNRPLQLPSPTERLAEADKAHHRVRVDLGDAALPVDMGISAIAPSGIMYYAHPLTPPAYVFYSPSELRARIQRSYMRLCDDVERAESLKSGVVKLGNSVLVMNSFGSSKVNAFYNGYTVGATPPSPSSRTIVIGKTVDALISMRLMVGTGTPNAHTPAFVPPAGFGFELDGMHHVAIMRDDIYRNNGTPDHVVADRLQEAVKTLLQEDALGTKSVPLGEEIINGPTNYHQSILGPVKDGRPPYTSIEITSPIGSWTLRVPTGVSRDYPTMADVQTGAESIIAENRKRVLAELANFPRIPKPPL